MSKGSTYQDVDLAIHSNIYLVGTRSFEDLPDRCN